MISFTQPALALAEGFGLAFSPCILPILPLILATSAAGDRWRPLQIVLGFVISFTLFSLISRQILIATGLQQDQIQFGAFFVLLAFGIIMLVPRLEENFAKLTGSLAGKAQNLSGGSLAAKRGGGFITGALIGLVWTPCAGPILAVALVQVIQSQTSLDAILTIGAFSIGAGLPMLAIGYSGQALVKYIRALSKHSVAIRRGMGVIIVIFALMGLMGFNIGEWIIAGPATAHEKTEEATMLQDPLEAAYEAPALEGAVTWLNSPPLDLKSLRGKVVLVDFWTYSCINCIRTLPHITSWYHKYKDDGLVVIGVHSPEFAFENKKENVEKALQKFGITYPVALDNEFKIWNNFKNQYWPAHYLIDREGRVVYTHFGEGNYDVTENNIRYLLGIKGAGEKSQVADVTSDDQTHETYLGQNRASNETKSGNVQDIPLHHWALSGAWNRTGEYIESQAPGASLSLHYRAKKVFLVMESKGGIKRPVKISLNGVEKTIYVSESKLYDIVLGSQSQEDTITLRIDDAHVRLYAFTFES